MLIGYILFWFVLMMIAIVNGVLRESTYGKWVNELSAHQISTITGILLSGLAVWTISRRWPLESELHAWVVGFAWLVLTLIFEFTFGHYVAGHPWERLFLDYNLLAGRVWVIFLVWVAVMPWVFYKLNNAKA